MTQAEQIANIDKNVRNNTERLNSIEPDVRRLCHEFFGENGDAEKGFITRFAVMNQTLLKLDQKVDAFINGVRKGAWVIGSGLVLYIFYAIIDHVMIAQAVTATPVITTIVEVVTATPIP